MTSVTLKLSIPQGSNLSITFPFSSRIERAHWQCWEAKLQNETAVLVSLSNETAVLVSLSMFSRLARLAREADPGNFRHPSSTVSRVYGLRTGQGGRVWTIVVGVADLTASRRPLIEPNEANPRELNDGTDHDSEKVVSYSSLSSHALSFFCR